MPQRIRHKTIRAALLAAPLAALLSAPASWAADLPDLGESSESVLSRQGELKLGDEAMRQLRSGGGYLNDPEVNAYLNRIGHRLTAADPAITGQFEFFAVPAAEINAFALPGGHIGINSGLILLAENESQLASVMAHEISHVTQHHIARQMAGQTNSALATLGTVAAAVLAARAGGGQAASGVLATAMAAQAQSQINFTREHEQEADRVGFKLLVDAGFDPQAMAVFFARMQQANRAMESSTPGYLRSHPLTHQRIAEAQDRALNAPYRQVVSSPEFPLVQALLKSYAGTPEEAVARLRDDLERSATGKRNAARYGYAAALLRAKSYPLALKQIESLDRDGFVHPMVEAMAGQILQQSGQYPAALQRYERALKHYPAYLQLVYDYPRTLILAKRHDAAAAFAEQELTLRRGDADLHQIAAEACAVLGQRMKSHYHQGEYYAATGNVPRATEQLELALRSGDGKFQDLSVAEMRLRELRAQTRNAEGKDKRGPKPSLVDRPGARGAMAAARDNL
jgi:beta-barrel assembly-enhancing protease